MGSRLGSRRSPDRSSARLASVIAVVLAVCVTGLTVVGATPLERLGADASAEAIEQALAELDAASRDRAAAADHFWRLDGELRELQAQQSSLNGGERETAAAIARRHAEAQAAAIDAYVWAGREDDLDHLFNSADVEARAIRQHFVVGRVDRAAEAVDELARARFGVDARLVELAELEGIVVARHETAADDLARAVAAEAAAQAAVDDARAKAVRLADATAERQRREEIERSVVSAAGPTEEQWERLRQCESTGNYEVVSSTGKYRGAYQFDIPTWESMGGTGDPAAAPPWEQDARAKALYELRGWQPWPHCGRHLIS